MQMSLMSKELNSKSTAWHGIHGFCVHGSSAIPTITEQIYQRISETMNAKGWHEKAGISQFRLLLFGVKRSRSDQQNTFLVKYARGYERSSICPLSTVLPSNRLQVLRPSLSGRAAGRSPFLNSVQFKENACRDHAPIHSYGFTSLVDTRYPCVWPRVLRSYFLQMWHDTDSISGKCSVFPLTKSSSLHG